MTAVVLCQGNKHNADTKLNYVGVKSCKMATQLFGGPKDCVYGCIGFGDCVEVCPYDAIHICEGVARINPLACHACKMCVNTCPKGIIDLMPLHETKAAVMCKNHDKGAQTRKDCKAGCIGCMKLGAACVESVEGRKLLREGRLRQVRRLRQMPRGVPGQVHRCYRARSEDNRNEGKLNN